MKYSITGRSKIVKKVILPFLLGLKFKTAVLVPLALALIALKTWKALTLGLLSLVLTGALLIFKLSKPKVTDKLWSEKNIYYVTVNCFRW